MGTCIVSGGISIMPTKPGAYTKIADTLAARISSVPTRTDSL